MLLADLASTEADPPPEIKTAVITHCPTIIHSLTHKVAPHGCPLYLPQPINNTAFKGKILLYEALGINQILSSFPNNINNNPNHKPLTSYAKYPLLITIVRKIFLKEITSCGYLQIALLLQPPPLIRHTDPHLKVIPRSALSTNHLAINHPLPQIGTPIGSCVQHPVNYLLIASQSRRAISIRKQILPIWTSFQYALASHHLLQRIIAPRADSICVQT